MAKSQSKENCKFVLNTDFSAAIEMNPKNNSQSDRIHAQSKYKIPTDLIDYGYDKYDKSTEILWVGLHCNGLIPSKQPIYIRSFLKRVETKFNKNKATLCKNRTH